MEIASESEATPEAPPEATSPASPSSSFLLFLLFLLLLFFFFSFAFFAFFCCSGTFGVCLGEEIVTCINVSAALILLPPNKSPFFLILSFQRIGRFPDKLLDATLHKKQVTKPFNCVNPSLPPPFPPYILLVSCSKVPFPEVCNAHHRQGIPNVSAHSRT